MDYVIFAVYVIFSATGALLIKAGADNPLSLTLTGGRIGVHAGWVTLVGLSFYFVSFLLWTKVLTTNDVTWIVPMATGIVQVLLLTGAIVLFHEPVNAMRLIGAAIVVCGLVVMNIKVKG